MQQLGAMVTQITSAMHMTDVVSIEVPSTTGWVTLSSSTRANVQAPRGDTSRSDPNEARADEYRAVVVYITEIAGLVGADPVSLVGGRITWHGRRYQVDTDDGERSHGRMRRLTCSREQTGVAPQLLTFTRRSRMTGVSTTIATLTCFVTLDQRGGYEVSLSSGAGDTQTAEGDSVTGVIVTTDDDGALVTIGDVFDYNGMPGRIYTEDRSDASRYEFGVVIERGAA